MIQINMKLKPSDLMSKIDQVFELAAGKIDSVAKTCGGDKGTPVFTVDGRYTMRGWTEWTQGFQYGSAIIQFDATGDYKYLEQGLNATREVMASHVSHIGVHDHGFNNVSTYGNLLRLWHEERLPGDMGGSDGDRHFYELALKITGAVQAARWTTLPGDLGYVCSFNGPHSLFSDTIRSMRALSVSHQLGHVLMAEQDRRINLLERSIQHGETTARYNVYFGEGRDIYDIRGRVVHESVFNVTNGCYRCPSTQQGYSPFSTWTRGLAWIICGFAEQLEFLDTLPAREFSGLKAGELKGKAAVIKRYLETARATADFYIEQTPSDGIPYWDTGAPGLVHLGDYMDRPAEFDNDYEPVDSSAALITAQGLIRLGKYLIEHGDKKAGERYFQAGLTVAARTFEEPYLCTDPKHQGLVLHSQYHRPNGWDNVPKGSKIPNGEATMWGDYHALELALLIKRLAGDGPYYKFYLDGKKR